MKISIVGLGLIGCSIAIDLRKSKFGTYFYGNDINENHQKEALKLEIIDEIATLDKICNNSDLIIISTPVNYSNNILHDILDRIPNNVYVTDVGSTKEQIILSSKNHKKRNQFIASHPMSGTERSGPSAAFSGLFNDKVAIICNKEESDENGVELIKRMYEAIGSKVIFMTAEAHDEHVGYVSHLSHVISYALALAVLDKEKDDENILQLASGGFASTARLAKSSAKMWTPIFEQNSKNILPIIDVYINKLNEFKSYLEKGETNKINNYIEEANRIKKVLN